MGPLKRKDKKLRKSNYSKMSNHRKFEIKINYKCLQ